MPALTRGPPEARTITRTMRDAIHVEELHVQYRSKGGRFVQAVDGLSFTVKPGEIVGFLGPNGAGKSSTLKTIMGFVQPTQGGCSIFGRPSADPAARDRVGYLPEVALYYSHLTPYETLKLYGQLQGLGGSSLKEEIHSLLEIVGLSSAAGKLNRTLSKGMLQRVGIAQSLLGSPELLILDEVTSGLDPVGRRELRNILRDRQMAGCTLFFSSHELSEVDMLCDRILLINQGRLVEERDLETLKEALRQYELTYRGPASLTGLTEDWNEVAPQTYRAVFGSKDRLIQALDRVHAEGAAVVDVVAQEGSLEDYFIDTIRRAA